MKTTLDVYEIREVKETDVFATYETVGFISPIKIRYCNDWKFSFVTPWPLISTDTIGGAMFLARKYNEKHCRDYPANLRKPIAPLPFTQRRERSEIKLQHV